MTRLSNLAWWFGQVDEEKGRHPGLDGMRSLVVLMVILIHLHLLGIGWMGISGFFVLSGFLITQVLLNDESKASNWSDYLKRFYGRRTLRIFPIYYLYLTILLLATFLVGRLEYVREDLPFAFLYVLNWYEVFEEPGRHSRMVNHLWSLSVEEQFYLVWPLVILLLPRRYLPRVALLIVVCGPLFRYLGGTLVVEQGAGANEAARPMFVYLMTTSHLDAFAIGALINFVAYKPKCLHYFLLVGLGLALGYLSNHAFGSLNDRPMQPLTLGWPFFLPENNQYIWGYSIVNLFWFMVICSILQGGLITRFFATRILDYLGKRSYATYIFHFPVLALFVPFWRMAQQSLGDNWGTLCIMPAYLIVLYGLAALSFKYVEMPMLDMKERLWPQRPEGAPAVVQEESFAKERGA